ncbi:hypothetical protein MAR_029333 [Mya arenaria]|uniref:Cyclase n=1 Tax=Mya arenaria TaxID=6604 RepID=A0ABY7DKM7_MYAAR|nr:hypothetical protein MAR_029333 [Mya arenaria]
MEIFEHQGTHIDAPLHFPNGRQDLTQIPPEHLYGPGVVIDVWDKAAANPDYAVTVQDILERKEFGRIPVGALVMMNSGWQFKYPDARRVFGLDNIQDPSERDRSGHSVHRPRQFARLCHNLLQPNNMSLLEYVANLDAIPRTGTTIVLGIRLRFGTARAAPHGNSPS